MQSTISKGRAPKEKLNKCVSHDTARNLLITCLREFSLNKIATKVIYGKLGAGVEFNIEDKGYHFYCTQGRIVDLSTNKRYRLANNTAKTAIAWARHQQYLNLIKTDSLFADYVRYHCLKRNIQCQLRHPGTGIIEDYFLAVPNSIFEQALWDTQTTKLLRSLPLGD